MSGLARKHPGSVSAKLHTLANESCRPPRSKRRTLGTPGIVNDRRRTYLHSEHRLGLIHRREARAARKEVSKATPEHSLISAGLVADELRCCPGMLRTQNIFLANISGIQHHLMVLSAKLLNVACATRLCQAPPVSHGWSDIRELVPSLLLQHGGTF